MKRLLTILLFLRIALCVCLMVGMEAWKVARKEWKCRTRRHMRNARISGQ